MDEKSFTRTLVAQVGEINKRNPPQVFDVTALDEVVPLVLKYQQNPRLVGHGGHCLVFRNAVVGPSGVADSGTPSGPVLKVIWKEKLNNKDTFQQDVMDVMKQFDRSGVVFAPFNFLEETKSFLVYSQPFCTPIEEPSNFVVNKILEVHRKILVHSIPVSDLYYPNFGFLDGKVALFDYGEPSYDFYFLNHTMQQNLERIGLKNKTLSDWKVPAFKPLPEWTTYQKFEFSDQAQVVPLETTLTKVQLAQSYLQPKWSVMDVGCCVGAIGLALKGQSKVTLVNCDAKELGMAKQVATQACATRFHEVEFLQTNAFDVSTQADLTLYFAVLHHMLRSKGIQSCLETIAKQTNRIAIVEVPLGDDALLQMVRDSGTHDCLKSVETFSSSVRDSGLFEIVHDTSITYNKSVDLVRHVFVLRKIDLVKD